MIVRLLDRATRRPVLTLFALAQAAALAVVGVRYLATLQLLGPGGEPTTGDFMAFYTGAVLLRRGRGAALYDLSAQRELQNSLAGVSLRYWQPYVNPPALALLLAPVAHLPYLQAFYIFTAAMCLALAGALVLLRPSLPSLCQDSAGWLTVALLVATFHPLFRTTIGGQNTSLTVLCLVGALALLRGGHRLAAGAALGALSFKPQYATGPLLLLALRRQGRALAAAAAVGVAHYAAGGLACGFDWPLKMLALMQQYRPLEWARNLHTHFSLLPFFQFIGRSLGAMWPLTMIAGASLVVVLVLFVRAERRVVARQDPETMAHLFALAIVVAMLLSPHLQYYDLGVLMVPALLALERWVVRTATMPRLGVRLLLAVGYHGYPSYQLARWVGFQPLTVWPVAIMLWLLRGFEG